MGELEEIGRDDKAADGHVHARILAASASDEFVKGESPKIFVVTASEPGRGQIISDLQKLV